MVVTSALVACVALASGTRAAHFSGNGFRRVDVAAAWLHETCCSADTLADGIIVANDGLRCDVHYWNALHFNDEVLLFFGSS